MNAINPEIQQKIQTILDEKAVDESLVTTTMIARWASVLPDALIEVWRTRGLVKLAEGRLRLIDPSRLKPIISYVLQDDVDLGGDTHPIAMGNLGEIMVWSERHGFGLLSADMRTLEMPYILEREPPHADTQIIDMVLQTPKELLEVYDQDQAPVHDRLLARLGSLPIGAIYGTTPAPAPPGGTPVEHYVVADAIDWLEALYTAVRVGLINWDFISEDQIRMRSLRNVGAPWSPEGPFAAKRSL